MSIVLMLQACVADDINVSSSAAEVTINLSNDYWIFPSTSPPHGHDQVGNLSWPFQLTELQAAYVSMRADVTSPNNPSPMLDKIFLTCAIPGADDVITTSQNHIGTGIKSYITRMLVIAPSDGDGIPSENVDITCNVEAEVWHSDDVNDYHTYKAGANTYLAVGSPLGNGSYARWGTESDSTYGQNCCYGSLANGHSCCPEDVGCTVDPRECTYVGYGLPAASSETVLKSGRFTAPAGATSLTAYSDIQLTACYADGDDCPDDAEGDPDDWDAGADIQLRLQVDQYCSSSSTVSAHTTYYPATGYYNFTISSDPNEHHT